MDNIEISVIIPVYNVQNYLSQCIESLLEQTQNNMELIFVNDASTDRSLDILKLYQERYNEKIVVIDSKENLRQGGARNLGIKKARGKYIGFVDSDDAVLPEMFEKLYCAITTSDSDAAFIQYASIDVEDDFRNVEISEPIFPWNEALLRCGETELTDKQREALIVYPLGGIYCGLYKKELLKRANIVFPEKLRYEDNYWMTLLKVYLNKVVFIEEIGYLYRNNPNSTVHKMNEDYQYKDRIKIEKMLLNDVEERGFLERYFSAFEYIFTVRYVLGTIDILLNKFEKPVFDVIMQLIQELHTEFPMWRKNPYYKELFTQKQKIKTKLLICYPKVFILLKTIVQKLR